MRLSLTAQAGGLMLLLAGPAMAATTTATSATPLTPQQTYQENVLCAATLQQAVGENLLAPRYPADKIKPLAEIYMDRAQKTGMALGMPSAQVTAAVQAKRQTLVDASKAPATAASARAEQIKLANVCAAIFGFELMQRLKGIM